MSKEDHGEDEDITEWKIQPKHIVFAKNPRPWLPFLDKILNETSRSGPRHPYHWLLALINISLATIMAFIAVELMVNGFSKTYYASFFRQTAVGSGSSARLSLY